MYLNLLTIQGLLVHVDEASLEPTAKQIKELSEPMSVCLLCERTPKKGTTEHHLIPRMCHRNKWFKKNFTREQMRKTIPLCRDCHNAVHKFVPKEKELGRHFYTLELLRSHSQISKFAAWASKQK